MTKHFIIEIKVLILFLQSTACLTLLCCRTFHSRSAHALQSNYGDKFTTYNEKNVSLISYKTADKIRFSLQLANTS